jgi:membrane-associated phospholipid phosphatase
LYLASVAAFANIPSGRRVRVIATATALVAGALWLARFDQGWPFLVRTSALPLVYLLAAYWTPAMLVSALSPAFEHRLVAFDSRWLRGRHLALATRAPRWLVEGLELAYLFCYPLIPAGWMCLHWGGSARDEERYWAALMFAAALCYGALPWLPTRPPRRTEPEGACRSPIRRLNLFALRRAGIQFNTFPSGHVATAFAAALVVFSAVPLAGGLLMLVALAIAIGSVVGRYHYAADALAGMVVALLAFAVSRLA